MAIQSSYVHDLPLISDPSQFEIPGYDISTNAGAKALMSSLKGDVGASPNISIKVHSLPAGSMPTVTKTGTETAPIFDFGLPNVSDGRTPIFQYANRYIQYRYDVSESWVNLVPIDNLIQPALDAATEATNAANAAEIAAGNANAATTSANNATTNANSAALSANSEAYSANLAASQANTAATNANNATNAANTAAQNANDAAANVKDGKTPVLQTGSVTDLPPDSQPTVNVTYTGDDQSGNPIYSISFGLVEGQQGIQGEYPELVNGSILTGAPGSSVSLTFTYSGVTTDGKPIYRIDGSIPQGAPGTGNGNVQVDATSLVSGNQYVFVPNQDGSPIGTFQPYTGVSDWNDITGKPTFATVATSGNYNDLSNLPNLDPYFMAYQTFDATATGVRQSSEVRSITAGVGPAFATQFPMVTNELAGAMPASAFVQIQQNTSDIASIKAGGGKRWPSQATKADLDSYGVPSGATQNDVITVRADETQGGATTQYVLIDSGSGLQWTFDYIIDQAPISIATETSLGIVKGSNVDGQQFIEADGSMSTVGWDDLKQRTTNLETSDLLKQDKKPDGINDLIAIDGKINNIYLNSLSGVSVINNYSVGSILYEDEDCIFRLKRVTVSGVLRSSLTCDSKINNVLNIETNYVTITGTGVNSSSMVIRAINPNSIDNVIWPASGTSSWNESGREYSFTLIYNNKALVVKVIPRGSGTTVWQDCFCIVNKIK